MPSKDSCTQGVKETKNEKYGISSKAVGTEPSKPFETGQGTPGLEAPPPRFQSCVGPVIPHYDPTSLFWNSNVFPVPMYVGNMCSLPFDLWNYFYATVMSLRNDLGLWNLNSLNT